MPQIFKFYTPFTSIHMDASFQRGEILFPIIMVLVFAALGTVPVFWSGRWALAILCLIVWAFLLYTLQAYMMRTAAYSSSDDGTYISPSVQSATKMIIFVFTMMLTAAYFVAQASWTGFLERMHQ